ncbi:MAG TPA: dihydropteroate synthase [Planctomycetota bacterium]|nr:dihydropteroate synthase [Planctomycetota bacterium]
MLRPLPPPGTTHVLGVINLTPDSFSDGGLFVSGAAGRERLAADAALAHAARLVADGAAMLDVGAVSTRPGSVGPPPEAEWARLQPVLGALRAAVTVPVSLDTTRASILRRALEVGVVDALNDVSALGDDPEMAATAAAGLPVILMHRRGTPATMQLAPHYDDAPREVREELLAAAARAQAAGIAPERILLDPGLGFGKRVGDNVALLAALPALRATGHRIVVGASRKSFLGALTGREAGEREHATTAVTVLAALAGADFVRVHDARAAADALAVARAVRAATSPPGGR